MTLPILAHLVSTGVGPFYDGAAHFFVSFEELLPVLALSLLAGLRGARAGRWLLAVLPVAWMIGGLAGLSAGVSTPPTATSAALLIVPGVLIAWDRKLPLAAILGLAFLFALWAGFVNGTAMAAAGAGAGAVMGASVAALVVAILLTAFATTRKAGWPRIAMRVAGSWLAALGLLALGWALRT